MSAVLASNRIDVCGGMILTDAAYTHEMTIDERAQLIEDIKKSDNLRRGIVERAELDRQFDVLAAWEEVEKIDVTINERIAAARKEQ